MSEAKPLSESKEARLRSVLDRYPDQSLHNVTCREIFATIDALRDRLIEVEVERDFAEKAFIAMQAQHAAAIARSPAAAAGVGASESGTGGRYACCGQRPAWIGGKPAPHAPDCKPKEDAPPPTPAAGPGLLTVEDRHRLIAHLEFVGSGGTGAGVRAMSKAFAKKLREVARQTEAAPAEPKP